MNRKRNVKARPKNRQRGPAANAASQRDATAAPMSTQDGSAARAEAQPSGSDSLAGSRQRPSGAAPTGRRRALDSGPATPGATAATARRGAFSPSRRTYLILTSLVVLVGIVATWAGNLQGLWWITPLAGLVIGLALRGAWLIALAAALVGLLGWGL